MKILLTGSSGMLGTYLRPTLTEIGEVFTLGSHSGDIECDLVKNTPDLGENEFQLVVHIAESSDETDAFDVNLEGTRHLLAALENNPPKELVYVSSWEVYNQDSGENVAEDHRRWPSTNVGKSKAQAEDIITKWCADHNVVHTILRPARMFGKGIKGEMAQLFRDVVNARYIHVRGNDARLSLVCASDVALAVKKLHSIGGIYNITDGRGAKWIELADAMSANSGMCKRQTFLPEKWAVLAWKLLPWLPAVRASLQPETLKKRSTTFTLSDSAIREAIPDWKPYSTIEVISRKAEDYPYQDF